MHIQVELIFLSSHVDLSIGIELIIVEVYCLLVLLQQIKDFVKFEE